MNKTKTLTKGAYRESLLGKVGKQISLAQQSIQTIILLATTAEQNRFQKNVMRTRLP